MAVSSDRGGYVPRVSEPEHVSATRAVYDATAETYAAWIGTELSADIEGPIDLAFVASFVELVPAGPVADVGCGPGRVAAFLAAQGVDVFGVDVSPAMVAIAREAHPAIRFEDGRLTGIPQPDHSLAGVVCWYSIIHTPPDQLPAVFAELERVLVPDGVVLVAFQAGDGVPVTRDGVYGTDLSLTNHRHSPDVVARLMAAAGLRIHARAERDPERDHESTPQAFLLARRAAERATAPGL